MVFINRLKQNVPVLWVIAIVALCGTPAGSETPVIQAIGWALLIGGVVAAVITMVHSPRRPSRVLYPLIAWVIVLIVSMLVARDVSRGLPHVVTWSCIAALFWVSSIVDDNRLERAAFAVVVMVALIAIYQEVIWWVFSGFPIEMPPRTTSVLLNPNNVGGVMLLGLALAAKSGRWGWVITFLFVIAFSAARSAMLGAVAGAVVFGYLAARRIAINRTVLIGALISGLVLLPLAVIGFFFNPTHGGTAQRLEIWSIAIRAFLTHPLTGIGPGVYPVVFQDMAQLVHDRIAPHAHSIYLNTAAETGIIGLIVLAWLIWVCITPLVDAYRHSKQGGEAEQHIVAIGMALAAGLLAQALTDYVYWMPINVLLALWTGRVILRMSKGPVQEIEKANHTRWRLAAIVGVGFVASIATLAIDIQSTVYMLWTTVLGCILAYLLYLVLGESSVISDRQAATAKDS